MTKLADYHDATPFLNGLRIAAYAAAAGFAAGAPVLTCQQELAVPLPEGLPAALAHVPGRHPDPDVAEDMRRLGRTLARAHRAIRACPIDLGPDHEWPWQWVERCLRTIPMEDRVRDAATQVWRETREMVASCGLATTLIHADPGLASFLLNDAAPERDGLIDWATPLRGPAGYDLASLQVLLCSHDPRSVGWCIEGYLAECPVVGDQLPQPPGTRAAPVDGARDLLRLADRSRDRPWVGHGRREPGRLVPGVRGMCAR